MDLRFDRDRVKSFGRLAWQRFLDDKCFETAGALSYTTLVSLVPLTVAVFAMFAAFPMFADSRDKLTDFVFQNFVPAAGQQVQEAMLTFASKASQLTGISVIVMLFSAVSMMMSIEDRLNRIWRVHKPRGWTSRLLLYWAALTLGPVLAVGVIGVTSYVTAVPLLHEAGDKLGLGEWLLGRLPFAATLLMLWLMYTMVPNCKVSRRDAFIGALLGAVLFEVARWGFTLFVRNAHNYQQIYGALAAIPIFLLWIYLSWIMVILGASIAASISAFEYVPGTGGAPQDAEFLGLLAVLKHFVAAQRRGESLDAAALREREPWLRPAAAAGYLDDLQRAELVQRGEGGWLLARSLDSTDLLRLYRHAGHRLPLDPAGEAGRLGIELPQPLLDLLEELAKKLDASLGTRLDRVYPLPVPTAVQHSR